MQNQAEANRERRLKALLKLANSKGASRYERATAWALAERLASKLDVILL